MQWRVEGVLLDVDDVVGTSRGLTEPWWGAGRRPEELTCGKTWGIDRMIKLFC